VSFSDCRQGKGHLSATSVRVGGVRCVCSGVVLQLQPPPGSKNRTAMLDYLGTCQAGVL
jgi:hypothetical protein